MKPVSLYLVRIFTLISVLFILNSCDSFFNNEKPSNNLITEEEVEVASETVSSSGGTVIVDDPSSEIDGMEIMVPEGSYSNSRTFRITTAAISSHNLGEYFNPITPLIQIENGSGYADSIMEVTIPISIEDGEIPLGFYYDEITGKLEAIPVKSYTNNSITLLTRHFMPASELSGDDEGLKGINIDATTNMIISSLQESIILKQTVINSGFKPGVDDWEFINYGSYIAPPGHCAGQSMTSLWYYYEKKLKGEKSLFHKYDLINNNIKPSFMSVDNSLGYRFASVIQNDFNFNGWLESLSLQSSKPAFVFTYFAAAILVTGEPQFILINNSQGRGGHAMIVYKVNLQEGKLYIADPNYPNNRAPGNGTESIRVVELVNGRLKSYETGLSAGTESIPMDQIGFAGKTAYIEWSQINKRFKQLADSTIGNIAPNTFPQYTISVDDYIDFKLIDGFTTDKDSLCFYAECPSAEIFSLVDGKKKIPLDAFDTDGNQIEKWNGLTYNAKVGLKPGLNKIGLYIYAKRTGVNYSNGQPKYLFIDFKWFDVYYSKLKIDPDPIVGEPGKDIEIIAMSQGTAPKDSKYVWNFGDGTKEVTEKNDSIVNHTFSKEGDFKVTVDLYDNTTNKLVGHAETEASIAKGILSELQKCDGFDINFSPELIYNCNYSLMYRPIGNNITPDGVSITPIVWSGTSFSANYNYSGTDGTGKSYSRKGSVSGKFSADGLTLISLNASEKLTFTNGGTVDQRLEAKNLPLDKNLYEKDYLTFASYGTDIKDNVVSFRTSYEDEDTNCSSTSADYTELDAWLQVTFD